ncbi:hypothetical protein [Paraoerskovia sediminicola]|nr:hypothetical protein [Paraoerskovia sediminicola]
MGLGFDTATEVGLLVLTGTAAATLPWPALAVLPVLFAAGMTLFDTLDGALVEHTFHLGDTHAATRRRSALAVTLLSTAVALAVGLVLLADLVKDLGHVDVPVLSTVADADTTWWGVAAVLAVLGVLVVGHVTRMLPRRAEPTAG